MIDDGPNMVHHGPMNTQSTPDTRPLVLPLAEIIIAGRNPDHIKPFIMDYRKRFPAAPALFNLGAPRPDREMVAPPVCTISVDVDLPVKPTRAVIALDTLSGLPANVAAKNIIVRSMSHTDRWEPCSLERFLSDWHATMAEVQPSKVIVKGAPFIIELENNNDAPVLFSGVVFGVSPG